MLSFWDRFGRATVERLDLRPGDQVLDACCGTGASALPAAHAVGPSGHVLGLDVAEPALELARAKAVKHGLTNVEFRAVDVEHTGLPSQSYHAVVCVFGVFFLPDMVAALAEFWRLVRTGGVLAVTVWGPRWVEPGASAFWDAVSTERPDLVRGFQPWTRVTEPAALSDLFRAAGAPTSDIEASAGTHRLADPGDFWPIVLGTGLRATVEQLDATAAARVRTATVDRLRADGVTELDVNVIYARARR
ncbi:MAG TPA: methyltransferase domain-containing protein [Micromonosporaceae bacterium]